MQSSGGVVTARVARERPLQTLLSGPVGGTMGLVALARTLGRPNLIGVDMGGTSFDVSLVVNGKPGRRRRETVARGLPAADADREHPHDRRRRRLDRLRRGRRAARRARERRRRSRAPPATGAAATRPTVTDANLVLGRIDPDTFAGGRMALDTEAPRVRGRAARRRARARRARPGRGDRVGDQREDGAGDPHAHGRAGNRAARLRARRLRGRRPDARGVPRAELGIGEVIVPRLAGAFSAWGMLETELRRDFTRPFFRRAVEADLEELAEICAQTPPRAARRSRRRACPRRRRVEHTLDMRYEAQEYTLAIPIDSPAAPSEPGFVETIARGSTRRTTPATGIRTRGAGRARRGQGGRASATSATPSREELAAGGDPPPSADARRALRRAGACRPPSSRATSSESAAARGPLDRRGGHRDHRRAAGLRADGRPVRLVDRRDRKDA